MCCYYMCVLFDKEYNRTSIDNTYDIFLDLCRNNSIDLDLLNFLNEAYFFRQNVAFHIELNYIKYSYEHEIELLWKLMKEKELDFLVNKLDLNILFTFLKNYIFCFYFCENIDLYS